MKKRGWREADDAELAEGCVSDAGDAREEFARRFGGRLKRRFVSFRKSVGRFSPDFEAFLRHVTRAVCSSYLKKRNRGGSGSIREHIRNLAMEDVYLASACASGDEDAWEVFDEKYRSYIRSVALSLVREEGLARELSGGLYTDLYVRDAGTDPSKSRLGGFTGRGSLFGWLRVVLYHKAMDLFRDRKGVISYEAVAEEKGESRIVSGRMAPPEIEEEENRAVLREVVSAEIETLSPRERGVLRFYYLEGLREREIGRIYGVHEATASRWIKRGRDGLARGIEKRLRRERGFSREEVRLFFEWAAGASEAGIGALFKKAAS